MCLRWQYSADVNYNGETRVNFGAPLLHQRLAFSMLVAWQAVTQIDLSGVVAMPDAYGRNIRL